MAKDIIGHGLRVSVTGPNSRVIAKNEVEQTVVHPSNF